MSDGKWRWVPPGSSPIKIGYLTAFVEDGRIVVDVYGANHLEANNEELCRRVASRLAERDALKARVAELELERDGERKAKELVLAGMASQTELYDGKKHRVRELEARVAELEERNTRLEGCFNDVLRELRHDSLDATQIGHVCAIINTVIS